MTTLFIKTKKDLVLIEERLKKEILMINRKICKFSIPPYLQQQKKGRAFLLRLKLWISCTEIYERSSICQWIVITIVLRNGTTVNLETEDIELGNDLFDKMSSLIDKEEEQ